MSMKRKIFILVPSLNEEVNIQQVVRVIDKGLDKYFSDSDNHIINIDCMSTDKTVELFNSCNTNSKKISLISSNKNYGKGMAIKIGIEYGLNKDGNYFLMLDSDLKSIKPIWIKKFLDELIKGEDFIVPIYKRNRYEGNTTNHFVSPIIYSCFGIDIQQPIAGDFGFNNKLAKEISRYYEINENYKYGIDGMISLIAINGKYKIKYIKLPNKIHNPSFPKINDTFFDECVTILFFINKNRNYIKHIIKTKKNIKLSKDFALDNIFIQKPSNEKIEFLRSEARLKIKDFSSKDKEYKNLTEVDTDSWTELTTDYLVKLLHRDYAYKSVILFSKEILPYFYLRVLNYFDNIENLSGYEINNLILTQKILMRHKLINKIK